MNLLLLFDQDFLPDGTVILRGRRALHAHKVLGANAGDALRVGRWRGLKGRGRVLESTAELLHLAVELTEPPPPKLGIDVLLAIPRPKALRKVLPALTSLGVGRIVLVNAAKVEKSYFTSKVLSLDALKDAVTLGLEQSEDTQPPVIAIKELFRPFVEDELAAVFKDAKKLLAHPGAERQVPDLVFEAHAQKVVLAIGPEGGWAPFELELLNSVGFTAFSLGQRTLRVEVVLPFALGQLQAKRALSP